MEMLGQRHEDFIINILAFSLSESLSARWVSQCLSVRAAPRTAHNACAASWPGEKQWTVILLCFEQQCISVLVCSRHVHIRTCVYIYICACINIHVCCQTALQKVCTDLNSYPQCNSVLNTVNFYNRKLSHWFLFAYFPLLVGPHDLEC